MSPESWQQVKKIFDEAVDLPLSSRHEFLRRECGGDEYLRAEVEQMIEADDADNSILDSPLIKLNNLWPDEPAHLAGMNIGRYRIVRELGRGGMGVVYEAVHETEDFTQRAALKIIKRGMDTDQILRRFRREQKILASLVHPNIARFLDGGMTDDNLPFYAMEYVEGRSLDSFCRDEQASSLDAKLSIFRQVCSAVHYAHQNLIIHRDLKPSNVIVTADGVPKLLDFGISKILGTGPTDEMLTATQFGMMTPAYASPEQVRGEAIGTASDIYSLGVVLCELLTGEKPYKVAVNSQLEIERAVCESEPLRPSAITSTRNDGMTAPKTNPGILRGDLDNIILMALRKEPAERYASVKEFSDDIGRYQDGLPIMARRHTVRYRATKFISRNRIGVAAGIVVVMALLTGIIVATWPARRAEQQQALAEKRFADVRELANNVVFKYHDAIAALPGSTAAREMLVTDALAYLDNLAQETAGDIALRKELSRAYLKMADVQGKMYSENIGDTAGALINYQKAIALLETLPDDEARIVLIQAYDSLAFLLLRGGNHLESREIVQRAVDINNQLPDNVEREIRAVDLHVRLGDVYVPDGARYDLRLEEHLKALPIAEKIWKADPNNFEKTKMLTRVYQRIGTDYAVIGQQHEERNQFEMVRPTYEQAIIYHERSLDTALKMSEIDPQNTSSRRFLAMAYSNLAESNALNENFGRALELANKSHEMIEAIFSADSANREARFDLALSYEVFAKIYQRQKNYPQYFKYADRSLEVFMAVFQLDPNNLEARLKLGELHGSLERAHQQIGNLERAAFHAKQSKFYGPN